MKIEDPNSLATIVGPTLGSSSMKGRCAPSVTLNSDINYINMFYMLESRPRPLRVVYANNNPYSIPMILSSASSDMCFCVDQIWPITSDLSSVDFLKFNLNTVITELSSFAESLNSDRCTCFVNNATKWLGKEDKLITIHIASYHFISAFVFLPNIDSHLDSDSSGSSHVVSFALESQHQLIKTKMSFQSQSGQLHSSLAHGVVPSWTIGRPNSLDINFSFATPGISLDWMSRVWYRVVPMPNTRAASHILSLVENKVNLVSGNLSWVGSLRPLDLCRMQLMSMLDEAPLVLLTSSEIQAETAPAPELSMFYCLYDMLSRVDGDASVTTVMNQLRAVQTELHNGNAISGNLL